MAVVNLDAIAGNSPPRIEIAGERSRSPSVAFVRTAATRILEQSGREPGRVSALGQLIDLAFPFSLYEHAPFVGRGTPALTITTAGTRPPSPFGDTPDRLNQQRLGEIGRSAQTLLGSLDAEVELAQGTSSYVYLGARSVRGWAIVFTLCAALLPCLAVIVDLFARLRRRRIALAPALRSFRTRLIFWLFAGLLFELFALLGVWGEGAARPLSPENSPGTDWPLLGLTVFTCFLAAAWLVVRPRLVPRRPVSAEEQLAGHTAALLALGIVSLLVVATNPYALIFVLPSLHAWIWLPQLREAPGLVRAGVLLAGLDRPGAAPRVVRDPLRSRPRRAVVHRGARRGRLRAARPGADRLLLGRGRRSADDAGRRPLRAVSHGLGAAAGGPAAGDLRPGRRCRPHPAAWLGRPPRHRRLTQPRRR